MMAVYRKTPVTVQAECWTDWKKPPSQVARSRHYYGVGWLSTVEGSMECRLGDWIITGAEGEVCLCNPSIFAATYELVE